MRTFQFPKFLRSDVVYYRQFFSTLSPLLIILALIELYMLVVAGDLKLAMLLLFGVLFGIAGTLLIAAAQLRHLLLPVAALNRAMQRVRSGEINVRVTGSSRGDLGQFQAEFNAFAEALDAGNDHLQEKIDQATREAQESMEVVEIRNAELDQARRRAVDASKAKTEFLANMSHEIRTPMNGVIGFTRLLSKTSLTAKQQDFVQTIEKSATSLLRIVDDILDFSRLESSKLVLNHEPFRLRECVESSVTLWAPQAHAKHLELVWIVYNDLPDHLIGDETRILQVLNNLIGNAIKFTEKGEIVVRVMLEEEDEHRVQLTFAVSDTGIGIPLGEQQRLFAAFDQGKHNPKNAFGGTGLGLSIGERLAAAMDGYINVSSRSGEGSVFRLTIKLEIDPEAPPRTFSPPLKRRGLLIDEHDLSRAALRNSLVDMGLAVDESKALPTLHKLEDDRYSVVVISVADDQTKLNDAHEFIHALIERYRIPVIALLSSSDEERLATLAKSGAMYCMSKPPRTRNLQEAIRGCLTAGSVDVKPVKEAISKRSPPPLDLQKPLLGKRCLAADDHPINLQLIVHLLEDLGAEVLPARDGEEAIKLMEENTIDMAFLDIHMPRMTGIEAAKHIRGLRPDDFIPIVALTADAAEKNQRDIDRAGIDRLIIKPVGEDELSRVATELFDPGIAPRKVIHTKKLTAQVTLMAARDKAQALRIAGGSEQIAGKLFDELMDELPAAIDDLRQYFANKDWSELWQLSHRLHGAAAVCGVPALYKALGDLQPALLLEDEASTSMMLDQVEQEFERIREVEKGVPPMEGD